MHPYKYDLDVRISQQVFTRRELTERLGLVPNYGSRPVIDGKAYWFKTLAQANTADIPLHDALTEALDLLEPHAPLFRQLRRHQGTIELHFGLFLTGMSGFYVMPGIMERAARLDIPLAFHLYPPQRTLAPD
jgi:hypothetical protein